MGEPVRAAMLVAPFRVEVVEVADPEPAEGQALVRVEANALCGSDLKAYRGAYTRGTFPTVLGHEPTGVVVDVGTGVGPDLVGQRVCIEPNVSCGHCTQCRRALPNLCRDYHLLGESLRYQGACAELVAVAAGQLHPVPAETTSVEAALVQPLAIAYEGIVHRGSVADGERVLVLGAGPIGLGVMLLAQLRGARVLVADIVEHRLGRARQLGADATVRIEGDQLDRAVAAWTDGCGVDVSVDAVGGAQSQSLSDAQRSTRPRGRIVVLGGFSGATTPFPMTGLKNQEQTLIGSHGHPGTFGPVIELLTAGRLRAAGMVSHVIGLDQVDDVLDRLHRRVDDILKVVVRP